MPSRGLDLHKSNNLSKWLNGPEFLCLDENRWPTGNLSNKKWQHCPGDEDNLPNENGSSVFEGVLDNSNTNNNQTGNEVMKISTLVAKTSNDTCSIDQIILMNNYHSLQKLLNITSYVCRFINNLKSRISRFNKEAITGEIKLNEINRRFHTKMT